MSELDKTKKRVSKVAVAKPESTQEESELLSLIKSMQAEIKELKASKENAQPIQYAYPNGNSNRYVEVVSLYDGSLFLSTQERGEGKKYHFKSFGNTQKIASNDLEDVVRVFHNFAINGHFYIKDSKFVEDSGLLEYYQGMLDKNQLNGIVDGKYGVEFAEMFKAAPEYQKSLIYQLAVKKVASGSYDASIIDKIERLANSYVKALNKNKIPRGESLPESLRVDIIEKGRSDSNYDERGDVKSKFSDDDE